jgi:phage terminase small subunit
MINVRCLNCAKIIIETFVLVSFITGKVKMMGNLNIKQKRFADYYIKTGNATESYIRAGYEAEGNAAEVNASRLLRNAKVLEYIKERNEQLDVAFVADITETKRFWTEIMRDADADLKDRLKASEYIAKTNGAFIEKKELQGSFNNKIEFRFVDPTIE